MRQGDPCAARSGFTGASASKRVRARRAATGLERLASWKSVVEATGVHRSPASTRSSRCSFRPAIDPRRPPRRARLRHDGERVALLDARIAAYRPERDLAALIDILTCFLKYDWCRLVADGWRRRTSRGAPTSRRCLRDPLRCSRWREISPPSSTRSASASPADLQGPRACTR